MIRSQHTASGRIIVRNSLLNLLGLTVPLMVGLITIPTIINGFGMERFGFLTISWAIVGYFGLFDIGLSRALTHMISKIIGVGKFNEIPELIWTSLLSMLILGIIGGIGIFLLSNVLVLNLLNVSEGLHEEFIISIRVLSLSIPIVIISTGLKGILEAYQKFTSTNIIQGFIGLSNFLSPMIVLFFTNNLVYIMVLLVLTRIVALVMYFRYLIWLIPDFFDKIGFKWHTLKRLLTFGGWVTVSTIIGPIMVYFDRFIIGMFISVSIVAYYTTPYEIVTKVTLLSVAISGALFPTLSAVLVSNLDKAIHLFDRAMRYVLISVFPIILIITTFASDALNLWLGDNFAQRSSYILQCLAIGVFINCVAFIPYSFIQASNRPDITAKIHLLELPVYLIVLVLLVKSFGIFGAAIAWTFRVSIDAGLLMFATLKISPKTSHVVSKTVILVLISVVCFIIGILIGGRDLSWYFVVFTLLSFLLIIWSFILSNDERIIIKGKVLKYLN